MAGIYIHIPFCKQACTYCNFHFSTSLAQKTNLLGALKKEIILTRETNDDLQIVETVYIGGGTPSLLEPKEIGDLLYTLKQNFNISPQAEVSLEANPDDIGNSVLEDWSKMGINRN